MPVDLEFVKHLASVGAELIQAAYAKTHTIDMKLSRSDIVTETDVAVERALIGEIKAKFPTHKFFCEETDHEVLTDEPTWIIDPVDGTTNFAHNFPLHACSVAYVEKQQTVLAACSFPYYKELFWAERGKGAFMNGKKITVGEQRGLRDALCATGFTVGFLHSTAEEDAAKIKKAREAVVSNFGKLLDSCCDIRRTGASVVDLCWVAAGRVDAFAEVGPHPWDIAAGSLIVQEAGGYAMGYGMQLLKLDQRCIVAASSKKLAEEISGMLEWYEV